MSTTRNHSALVGVTFQLALVHTSINPSHFKYSSAYIHRPGATLKRPAVTRLGETEGMPGHSAIPAMATLPPVNAPGLRQSAEKAVARMNPLLTPYKLGSFKLSHRIVYAPLTRCRSYGHVPQPEHAALYYSQRTSEGGLVISEATAVSETSIGYPCVPGIWSQEQIIAWKHIVEAVHAKGGIFFCQLWHAGRFSHTSYQPNGAAPPSSTNQRIKNYGPMYLGDGALAEVSQPCAIETHEIARYVEEFAQAARNAIEAGFDGVEIHAANGYLIDQFLRDAANDRTDEYGGSVENRCRFLFDIVDAVGKAIGSTRVGVRISPFTEVLEVTDSQPAVLSAHIAETLNDHKVLYLHVIEPRLDPHVETPTEDAMIPIRRAFKGTFIAGGGYTCATGMKAIESGKADLIVYGRLFLSNPDLPRRFALNAPLNKYDRTTFYTQDPVLGYTDYPFLEDLVEPQT